MQAQLSSAWFRCVYDDISQNVEAYMDDIMVRSNKGSDVLADLTETFNSLNLGDTTQPCYVRFLSPN